MIAVLRDRRGFRRLLLAHAQSQLGSGAAYVALLLIAYHRLHSGWAVALVLLGDFLPGIVLAAPFGALADRLDRRRLAVVADLIRATAFVAIAVIPSFGATIAFALLAGVGSALWRPAVNSALPGLVADAERSAATAAYSLCQSLGLTMGPALSALALLVFSPAAVLAVNGVTFAISALTLAGVPLGRAPREPEPAPASPPAGRARYGLRAVVRVPGVAALIALSSATLLGAAMMNVAEPLLSVGPLHGGGAGYAMLVVFYGLGMTIGGVVNSRAPSAVDRLRGRWLAGMALTGAMLVASGLAPGLVIATATFALTGVGNALTTGPELRLLQELTPERMLGRVFGLYDAVQNGALAIAFVLGGLLLGMAGARTVFLLAGGLTVTVSMLGALSLRTAGVRPAVPVLEPVGPTLEPAVGG